MSFAERMMLWDTMLYLPGDVLAKVDRATMATSLEARAPLLDQRIFAFVWSLPETMKIRNGNGKHLLRELLAHKDAWDVVTFEDVKQAPKGFAQPVAAW
jgi:asparagine synthase (glutamine-hydrolysing)